MRYILEKALSWLDNGIATIPVRFGQKIAAVDWKQYQTQLPTRNQVMQWFGRGFYNLAIVTGWQGLTVLDWDSLESWQEWQARTGIDTYSVITARGVHSYFYTQQESPTFHKQGLLDIQGPGRYVLGVPSVHPSRAIYQDLYQDMPIMRVQSVYEVIPDLAQWEKEQPATMATRQGTIEPQPSQLPDNPLDCLDAPPVPNLTATIKSRYSILDMFPDAEKTQEHWYITRCPFHDDHNPSFWIDTNKGLCGCFAGCTPKPLDVINLYSRLNNLNNSQAVQVLGDRIRK